MKITLMFNINWCKILSMNSRTWILAYRASAVPSLLSLQSLMPQVRLRDMWLLGQVQKMDAKRAGKYSQPAMAKRHQQKQETHAWTILHRDKSRYRLIIF